MFSLKIHLFPVTLTSTWSVIYNLVISSIRKVLQFWLSSSSQLFQWLYLGLTDLNLKGNAVDEIPKPASVCNLYFLSGFKRNKKM